jgi:uncharacterized protein
MFDDPFSGNTKKFNSNEELLRALQRDIAEELSAIFIYESHIEATDNEDVKKVLTSIKNEEQVHVGELNQLIDEVSNDEDWELNIDLYNKGVEEVYDLLDECISKYEEKNKLLEVKDKEYEGVEFSGIMINITDDNADEQLIKVKQLSKEIRKKGYNAIIVKEDRNHKALYIDSNYKITKEDRNLLESDYNYNDVWEFWEKSNDDILSILDIIGIDYEVKIDSHNNPIIKLIKDTRYTINFSCDKGFIRCQIFASKIMIFDKRKLKEFLVWFNKEVESILKNDKLLESYSNDANKIAQIILEQLGGNKFATMIGMYNPLYDEEGNFSFRFKAKALNKANYCKVIYNSNHDDYDMIMGTIRGNDYKEIYHIEHLYAKDLYEVFENETGLRTKL